MFYNRESVYYIMMTKYASNNNLTECNHPSKNVVLTPEGEYICTICGIVLTPDQAAECNVYAGDEVVGVIDPHSKTNPWLLGLGSVIPNSYLAKVAKRRNVANDHDSKFANIIVELELERYGQELMDIYHTYTKFKEDYASSAYLTIMKVIQRNNLNLDDREVKKIIQRHYNVNVKAIPSEAVVYVSKFARHFGSKSAVKVFYKVMKKW